MGERTYFGGLPGTTYDRAWWGAVHALFDEAFPGLPAGIARAAAVGVDWADVTTPFAVFEGERCVAHVGVLAHPVVLRGRRVVVAGVHAVCTAADRRRQGLCRATLGDALAWADGWSHVAKLNTDDPPVYAGAGFRAVPNWRFRSAVSPVSGVRARLMAPGSVPADAELLRGQLACRAPVSAIVDTGDPGWLFTIDAALSRRLDRCLWHLPDHDAIVAIEHVGGERRVLDVVAERMPPASVVLGVGGPTPAVWSFTPDLLDPDATPERVPEREGVFMVRGDWPDDLGAFGVSPLWEH